MNVERKIIVIFYQCFCWYFMYCFWNTVFVQRFNTIHVRFWFYMWIILYLVLYLKVLFESYREINADMDDSCQFLSCVHEISKCPMSLLLMLNSFRYLRTQTFPNSIYCIIQNTCRTITSISIDTRTLVLVDLHLNNSIYNQTFDMWLCHLVVSVHRITWAFLVIIICYDVHILSL